MSNANTGYLFYKDYYRPENGNYLKYNQANDADKKHNEQMLVPRNNTILSRITYEGDFLYPPQFKRTENRNIVNLTYQTGYPGLVLGTGYTHEAGLMGEFKLGFYFDYTTGMPIIPGSSVKGILRSVFPGREQDPELKKAKEKYLWFLLGQSGEADAAKIALIENEIFEGINPDNTGSDSPKEKYLSVYKQDTFFDAVLTAGEPNEGKIFATDYITPHKHESDRALDQFTDPTPLMFLKVLPEVAFEFSFCLSDGTLNVDQKLDLFHNILLEMGIGAKTNVGYGQMYE